MKSTITKKQQLSIQKFLKGKHIPQGLGTKDEACSIAAINLALYGKLSDTIPGCMSEIIGEWIIVIQDSMPDDIRNSNGWRNLLPLAAGTGRNEEQERKRLNIILDHMWTTLELLQPIADKNNFGNEWKAMTKERTVEAALAAADVAANAANNSANAAANAAYSANNTNITAPAAHAANAAHTANAADAAARVSSYIARATSWKKVDPCGLLTKLIEA